MQQDQQGRSEERKYQIERTKGTNTGGPDSGEQQTARREYKWETEKNETRETGGGEEDEAFRDGGIFVNTGGSDDHRDALY